MNFRLLLLLLLVLIIFSSCNKESLEPEIEETQESENEEITFEYSEIIGNWQWIKSIGGLSGQEINPTTEGVNICLIIDELTIRFITNDTIQEEFEYEIALGKSIYNTDSLQMIKIEGYLAYSYVFEFGSILLREEVFDGYIHEYIQK